MFRTSVFILASGLAGVIGSSAQADDSYAARAAEVTDYIETKFRQSGSGGFVKSTADASPEDMWGNGVLFSTYVAAARHDRGKYEMRLKQFFETMDTHWDAKVLIPGYEPLPTAGGGSDKYYDDNAWMVITFLEAYELTGDKRYLDRADLTLKFVLSGWDEEGGGGIWWHEGRKEGTKNTCANAPAAVGCLRLARYVPADNAKILVKRAEEITRWTSATFQDEDGLFWDSKNIETGHINRGKLTYNTALMIRAYLGLNRQTGDETALAEAKRIGNAAAVFMGRRRPAYRNHVKWSHLLVEADLELYRITKDETFRGRAKQNADSHYTSWKSNPPADAIANASIARELWLVADNETEVGRAFWAKADVPASN